MSQIAEQNQGKYWKDNSNKKGGKEFKSVCACMLKERVRQK